MSDSMLLIKSVVMGIVEGVTEFLPISSTGHLILTAELLDFLPRDERAVYEIFIQLGAVAAVALEYRQRFATMLLRFFRSGPERRLLLNMLLGFFPAALAGLTFGDAIKAHLFTPIPVSLAFIAGGLLILWAEKRQHQIHVTTVDDLNPRTAMLIGIAQCLALIPGTSRSGATIIGGLFLGLSRTAATEFSSFLGVPTLAAAALYSLYKARNDLDFSDAGVFTIGSVAAFISAFVAIRALLRFISRHTFVGFAWYRIAFGLLVLVTALTGVVNWSG